MLEEARRQSDEILDTADRDATARREEAEAYYEHQRAAAAQAALDFEQTLAERRERAERDFTTQTAAAQAQLGQLQDTLAGQRREGERDRAQAQAEAKRIVDEARQQAEHLVSEAQARVSRIRSESERELSAASARRDSINAQLANVRQMLATLTGSSGGPADEPEPVAAPSVEVADEHDARAERRDLGPSTPTSTASTATHDHEEQGEDAQDKEHVHS